MISIDARTLHQMAPRRSGQRAARQSEIIDGMGDALAATLDHYEINTCLRVAHFLSQVAYESDGFCTTEEYASGRSYENRADLGNTEPGDGPRFKGRGLIQLTGRANYKRVGDLLDLDLVGSPQSVNSAVIYLIVSCVFWNHKNINQACDQNDIITVTQLVNGGMNGLVDRKIYLAKARTLVAALSAGTATPPGRGIPVLHRGSNGEAVINLQKRLSTMGYPVALDGDFGASTEIAVQHFQAAADMEADGVVGVQTWQAMLMRAHDGR